MKHAVIVPYRNRPHQLVQFIKCISNYLPQSLIVIVDQVDNLPFNRGKLLNIGFLISQEQGCPTVVFHDVDKIPLSVNYDREYPIVQLAGSTIQTTGYFGGVTQFNAETFKRIGGFTNEFYCRAEDNELFFRVRKMGEAIHYRPSKFEDLPHPRTGSEFDQGLWIRAQQPRKEDDGLEHCKYQMVERSEGHGIIYLKVDLNWPAH